MTDDEVEIGETATVDVVLEGQLVSSTIRSYLAEVTYDYSLLQAPALSDVIPGPGLPSVFFSANVSTPGKVRFGCVFLKPVTVSSGQALVTINFRDRGTPGVALLSATAKITDASRVSRTPPSAPPGTITIGGDEKAAIADEPDASLAVPFFNNEAEFATMVSVFNNGDEPVRAVLRMYPTSRADGTVGEPALYDVLVGPGEADLVNTLEMASESGLSASTSGDVSGSVGGIVVDLFGVSSGGEAILDKVSVGAFIRGTNGAMYKAPVCPIGAEGGRLMAPLFMNRDAFTSYVLVFNTSEEANAAGAVELVSGGEVVAGLGFDIPACGIEVIDTAAGTSAVGRSLSVSGAGGGKSGGVILDAPAGVVGVVSVFDESGGAVAFDLSR